MVDNRSEKAMARSSGKSTVEYVLILALVGLFALPGLMFLQNQLVAIYQQNEPTRQAGNLFALLNPKAKAQLGAVPSSPLPTLPPPSSGATNPSAYLEKYQSWLNGQEELKVSIGPDGKYLFTLPDGTPVGSSTNSAEGSVTAVLADLITQISENAQTDVGEPLSDFVKTRLRRMSETAHYLAETETAFVPGELHSSNYDVIDALDLFNDEFDWLHKNIKDDSNYKTLYEEIKKHGGVVSNLALQNYIIPNYTDTSFNAYINTKDRAAIGLGTPPSMRVPIDLTPPITHHKADHMGRMAQQPASVPPAP